MSTKCKECTKVKHRSEEDKKKLIRRLNIISGQVNGLKQMIESDRYCDDVLIQISSVNKSLKSLGNEILRNHMETCVVKDLKEDKLEVIDEVIDLFGRINS